MTAKSNIGPILGVLGALLPAPVIVVETDSLPPDELLDEERRLIDTTRPGRRAEFLSGRVCARRALAALGIERFALLRDENRAPIWPTDIAGSLTHTASYTAAAVARRADVPSLGIDVEQVGRLSESRWSFVFTAGEQAMLQGLPGSRRTALAAILFSAKEAYYKCRYQVSREPLGFHDVEIVVAGEAFQVRPTDAALRDRRVHVPASGCFEVRGDWVFVGVVASATDGAPASDGALRSRLQ